MGEYTYRTIDLTTGVVLNDLPLVVDSLPRVISGDADTTFTLPLYDKDLQELKPKDSTTPGRTGLFALRDDTPVWGGIIWARSYSRSTRVLTLTTSTIESYYRRRVFNQRMQMTSRDQITILVWMMAGIWPFAGFTNQNERQLHFALGPNYNTYTALDPSSGMWVTDYDGQQIAVADSMALVRYPYSYDPDTQSFNTTCTLSGVLRDRTYDAGKNVFDAMVELANVAGGPEWTFDPVRFSDESLGWQPRFGYSRLGKTVDKTSWSWIASMPRMVDPEDEEEDNSGDNVRDYDYTEDTRKSANHLVSTGAETNGIVLVSDRGEIQSIRNGYPLIQQLTSYQDVIYQSTLDAHAEGDKADATLPLKTTVWEVSPDQEPEFGSYALGDEGSFGASDDLDPPQDNGLPGRVSVDRIVGWSLVPGGSETLETVKLNTTPTTQPSPRQPPSLKARYDNWERQIKGLSIVSKTPQSNVAVSSTNTQPVLVPHSGTAGIDGPLTVITSYYFPRQADVLHGLFMIVSGLAGLNWDFYDTRSNSAIPTSQVLAKGVSGQPGAVYDLNCSLKGWAYGEMVEIELRAYVTGSSSTTSNRTLRSWAAYQGPK